MWIFNSTHGNIHYENLFFGFNTHVLLLLFNDSCLYNMAIGEKVSTPASHSLDALRISAV